MNKTVNSEIMLLQQAKAFDENALAEIYDEFSTGLYRYALRQMGDQHQAEDCVAETFSRFLTALKNGKGPNNHIRAYLYRIAHNWIMDQFRRSGPPEIALEAELIPDENIENYPEKIVSSRLAQEIIRDNLAKLTADQRQVIVLKFIEGWRNKEIAEAIKKPVGAVKSLQHRGLKRLKKLMGTGEAVV